MSSADVTGMKPELAAIGEAVVGSLAITAVCSAVLLVLSAIVGG